MRQVNLVPLAKSKLTSPISPRVTPSSCLPVCQRSCHIHLDNATGDSPVTDGDASTSTARSADYVIIYGGFSGEAVEGDVLQIDVKVC